jgi:hypothetical protein
MTTEPVFAADNDRADPLAAQIVSSTRKVTVQHPFQVVHEGVRFGPGETADVPEHVAAPWITNGWVSDDAGTRQRGKAK